MIEKCGNDRVATQTTGHMKLTAFRVAKFRNIVDSERIQVDPSVTCLVGKNEAGKSALIEALYLFNPGLRRNI